MDSDSDVLPPTALSSLVLNIPGGAPVCPPLVFRRCPCCCSPSGPTSPLGMLANSASDDKRMWDQGKVTEAVNAAGFPELAGRAWQFRVRVGDDMVPLGSGQRLIDSPDGQVYIHILPLPLPFGDRLPLFPPHIIAGGTTLFGSSSSPPSLSSPANSSTTLPRADASPALPRGPSVMKRARAEDTPAAAPPSSSSPSSSSSLPLPLNPPLFIFSSPSSLERLPLFTELRGMVELGLVASLKHFVVDASFTDLKRRVMSLKPGGLHIAAHVLPGSEDCEPKFMFRDDSGEGIRRGGSGSSVGGFSLHSHPTVQPPVSAAPPHAPVPFSDLVEFLRPCGVLQPGGFLEFVFVNACCSEGLLNQLTSLCGIPFAFGWSTKAIDSGCFAFAHAFYKCLARPRLKARQDEGSVPTRRPTTYSRAFDSAVKEYVGMGFIMDDPSRLAVVQDDTGLGRHADYTPPVVHGIPVCKKLPTYTATYGGVPRLPLYQGSKTSWGDIDSQATAWLHPQPSPVNDTADVEARGDVDVAVHAALSDGEASGYDSDCSEAAAQHVSTSRRRGTRSGSECLAPSPTTLPYMYSVEIELRGKLFATDVVSQFTSRVTGAGFHYDVVDVRPSDMLNGRFIALFKVFGREKAAVENVVEDLSKFVAALPKPSPRPAVAHIHTDTLDSSASFGMEDDDERTDDITVKQVCEVHPVAGTPSMLVTKFIKFTGNLWTSGFMSDVILTRFSDPRCKGHIRLPAAACHFAMAELQSSSVVVQVSDDSPTGCTELIRMLEVNRNVFNAMRQAKDRIRSQPVAFPTPETSPDRSAMTFEWRVIIDVGGDLIKSGFARDMYYTVMRVRDPIVTGEEDAEDLTDAQRDRNMDFMILSFECGVEELAASKISLAVSAASRTTLWRVFNRIDALSRDFLSSAGAVIDVSIRWLRGTTFLGQGVDIDFGCPDSDDDGSDEEDVVTPESVAVSIPTRFSVPTADADAISHAPSSVQSVGSQVLPSPSRIVKITGPIVSSGFLRILASLSKAYSRFLRPRLVCLRKGHEQKSVVFMQVYGSNEREREHFAALLHTAVESFANGGSSIQAVNMSLIPGRPLLSRAVIDECANTCSVPLPGGVSLPDPLDVPSSGVEPTGSEGVLGYPAGAVAEDTDVSSLSRLHHARVQLDIWLLTHLQGVLMSLEADCTVNIAPVSTGFDISSNSDTGIYATRVVIGELIRNVQAELPR